MGDESRWRTPGTQPRPLTPGRVPDVRIPTMGVPTPLDHRGLGPWCPHAGRRACSPAPAGTCSGRPGRACAPRNKMELSRLFFRCGDGHQRGWRALLNRLARDHALADIAPPGQLELDFE